MMTCALKTQNRSRATCKDKIPLQSPSPLISLWTPECCCEGCCWLWRDLSHAAGTCCALRGSIAPSTPSSDTSALGPLCVFFRASHPVCSWARRQFLLQARKSPHGRSSWEPAALLSACLWPPSPAGSHTWASPLPAPGSFLTTEQREAFALAHSKEKGPSPG